MSRRLLEFGVLCALLTWVPWATLGVLGIGIDAGLGSITFGLAASGPSLAVLGMWVWRRERRPGPTARWSPTWVAAAVVLAAAPGTLVAGATHFHNLSVIPHHAGAVIAEVGIPAAVAYTLLAGPIAEEFGWRGYVQPRLRQRFDRLATVTILGAAWGVWHVPLFFMAGTGQQELGLFTSQGAAFFLGLFPLSHLMLFVSENLRGGVPAAILMHATWNLVGELMPRGAGADWFELLVLTALALLVEIALRKRPNRGALRTPAVP